MIELIIDLCDMHAEVSFFVCGFGIQYNGSLLEDRKNTFSCHYSIIIYTICDKNNIFCSKHNLSRILTIVQKDIPVYK